MGETAENWMAMPETGRQAGVGTATPINNTADGLADAAATGPSARNGTDGRARTPAPGAGHPQPAPLPAATRMATPQTGGDVEKPARPWLKPVLLGAGLIALILGVQWGVRYWHWAQVHASTDDAYLTTDVIQITPQVNG